MGDSDAAARLGHLYPQAAASASGAVPATVGPPSEPMRRAGPLSPDKVQGVLDAAQMLAGKGRKPEAYAKYREVLEAEPAHAEALGWVEEYLRGKRDHGTLRDVLTAAVRAMGHTPEDIELRKERLREVAGLCEGNLRDVDGAINAWKQLVFLDRTDEGARTALARILDRTQRWDELAQLLEQEASAEPDLEKRVTLERRLANLHEQKRRDFAAAAEAWGRIAQKVPDDDRAVLTASKLYEKAGQLASAAQVIADGARGVDDPVARGNLLERLADLREQLADPVAAGEAFALAADALKTARLWDAAERCFVTAERWPQAANAATSRAQLTTDLKGQASLLARAAEFLSKAGDETGAVSRLEQAVHLDPTSDEYAAQLRDQYGAAGETTKLVEMLATRGDRLADRVKRVALRREAAALYATQLGDKEASREQWLKVLEDGDDREALEKLVDYAVEREDHTEACTLLRRLGHIAVDKADKARIALREAEILADGVRDIDSAIQRYESILETLDATSRPALQAIADLAENRKDWGMAADALERELKLVADTQERGVIAGRLSRLYERLELPHAAIRALDIVRKADAENFDALERLCELCERTEQWDRVAELLHERIEIEADEHEASTLTRHLADVLATRLDRGDEALGALTQLADGGDASCRQAYVELGDRLGWQGLVAQKLVDWWMEAKHGQERTQNLRSAYERFAEVGREQDAVRVAVEIVHAKGADKSLAARLETLALKTSDADALEVSQDLLVAGLSGLERATELVRQAEVRVRAGLSRVEALEHGESGLGAVPPATAEKLVERLALLPEKPWEVVDLYERHATRAKNPVDRVRALARAAQVAAAKGQMNRAAGFFELALTGTPTDETNRARRRRRDRRRASAPHALRGDGIGRPRRA
jgi:tetratricopeptide (TPR) repeat protein